MVIKPLPQELIGKLEVALHYRNREWALALFDEALASEKQQATVSDETPLIELFTVKEAGVLESGGLIYFGDLRRADLNELKTCRGIGPYLFQKVKGVLNQ